VSLSSPFIRRPVGTTLLTIAVALAGALAYFFLPVAPLPQVEFPTISVQAALPGASPETMASAVATPLERQFGRIAGINEITSTSYLGSTSITMQFDLNRNIDAAARDVQAAINAARGYLPANLPNNPTYRKVNPADAPVLIIALTSDTYDRARMYDVASSILAQKLSQIQGIGQVNVGGGALPAVRVEVNASRLNARQMSLEDVRNALANANANRPKGWLQNDNRSEVLNTTDQLQKASEYQPLVIAYRNGAPVRLSDIATVVDSLEDLRTAGLYDDKKSISLVIFRQPGANIIETVDRVLAMLPEFQADIPAGIKLSLAMDRTTTIRASVHDVEVALCVSTLLVILVVFVFLRSVRTTFIPSIAVPVSLVGTFGVMYLCGYSIDNLSLMALAIATGFVVDDAIVVIENISRHLEQGMQPMAAALLGAQEIGFTVLSMSVSLVAVFIPILMMGGIVGRLFREFAVTLSAAITVSLLVSLTATPMMCAKLLKSKDQERHGPLFAASERVFNWILREYEISLSWVMRHQPLMLLITLATIGFTIYLYLVIPKGFFPQQDTGRLMGNIQADQDTSFASMDRILTQYAIVLSDDPAVDNVVTFTGGGQNQSNSARMFVALKPLNERQLPADQIMMRLRAKAARIPGATLVLQATQDLRIGGRMSSAQYQYTLQSESLADLNEYAPQMLQKMRKIPGLADVNTDQQNNGLQATLTYDRTTASRMGISTQLIDDILYDAFGQRQVSTMYRQLNQYHVVMEVDPKFSQNPDALDHIYIPAANRGQVPLSAFAHYAPSTSPLAVNHSSQFPSATISFNTLPGVSLSDAVNRVEEAERELQLPDTVHGSFSGTAQAYQDSLSSELILVITALLAVYIVLGILYESYIHPITILSTLPSAGVGALLALLICHIDLSIIALIGILLLIGIVKKNAIMMIDFALDAERKQGTSPDEAIVQACILRFRPIIMTTMAALLGAFPLALGMGIGAELRRPLGIAIIGGLIFSQVLTLYTTPVVYVYLDRLRLWLRPPRPLPLPGPASFPA
jgi:multidrug efflux pump